MTQPVDRGDAPPLVASRRFEARRATLFRAWSCAERIRAGFSPRTYSVAEARVELRVGGAFEVCMRSPAGDLHWSRGRFVEVTQDVRLVSEMDVADPAGRVLFGAHMVVTFSDAAGGGTTMEVVRNGGMKRRSRRFGRR